MKIYLTPELSENQKKYISFHLAEIRTDRDSSFIFTGSKNLLGFLKLLSFQNVTIEQPIVLTYNEKENIATQLIECIIKDEQAFIEIMLTESSTLRAICSLPFLSDYVDQLIATTATIIKNNKDVKETFFESVMDIDRVFGINPNSASIFRELLIETNELERFIKKPEQLCFEINRYPHLYEFFILAALRNDRLFDLTFTSKNDLLTLNSVLAKHNLFLAEAVTITIEQKIEERISKQHALVASGTYYNFFPQIHPTLNNIQISASNNHKIVLL